MRYAIVARERPRYSVRQLCRALEVSVSCFHEYTLKNEEVIGVYAIKADAHAAIASYIHGFYNPTRLHSTLGYVSPNDYARKLKQAA